MNKPTGCDCLARLFEMCLAILLRVVGLGMLGKSGRSLVMLLYCTRKVWIEVRKPISLPPQRAGRVPKLANVPTWEPEASIAQPLLDLSIQDGIQLQVVQGRRYSCILCASAAAAERKRP